GRAAGHFTPHHVPDRFSALLKSFSAPLKSLSALLESLSAPPESLSALLESLSAPLESFSAPLASLSAPLKGFSAPLESLSALRSDVSPRLDDPEVSAGAGDSSLKQGIVAAAPASGALFSGKRCQDAASQRRFLNQLRSADHTPLLSVPAAPLW